MTKSRIFRSEHSRHRSPTNFVVHLIAGLIAYSHQDKKPGLHLDKRVLLECLDGPRMSALFSQATTVQIEGMVTIFLAFLVEDGFKILDGCVVIFKTKQGESAALGILWLFIAQLE